MTSASARACSAWWLTLASSVVPPASQPPVSMMENGTPIHSAVSTLRSRVTPGSSSTTAARSPTMRLTRDDLPTLGRPATTTMGSVTKVGTAHAAHPAPERRAVEGTAERAAVARDDLDRPGQVGQGEPVEEAPLVQAGVGQQVAHVGAARPAGPGPGPHRSAGRPRRCCPRRSRCGSRAPSTSSRGCAATSGLRTRAP